MLNGSHNGAAADASDRRARRRRGPGCGGACRARPTGRARRRRGVGPPARDAAARRQGVRRAADPAAVQRHHVPERRGLRRARHRRARSRSSRSAPTTCCRSRARRTSPTCPGSGSWGYRSSPASSSSTRARLQLQERLTTQVADWLEEHLQPRGVGVVLEAEHLCMSLRGVQTSGSNTVTSALRGAVKEDARTRQEFLSLINSG